MFKTDLTKLSFGTLLCARRCFVVKSVSAPVSGALSDYKFCGYQRVRPDVVLINQNGHVTQQPLPCFRVLIVLKLCQTRLLVYHITDVFVPNSKLLLRNKTNSYFLILCLFILYQYFWQLCDFVKPNTSIFKFVNIFVPFGSKLSRFMLII